MGTLFLVATPIGNLDDISVRAVKTLFTVDAIACEDTRRAGQLMKLLSERLPEYGGQLDENIKQQRLISYYEQNEFQRIPEIINGLKNGLSIALISDAGTPLISDPGYKLVREAIKEGIRVESIPGPSSVISALVSSGLPPDKFLFVGYPPRKPGHRKTLFENIKKSQELVKSTCILFEAPHKLVRTLEEMKEVFGDIEVVIARELTKMHEEITKEKISEFLQHFVKTTPKGEFVLLFNTNLDK